MSTLREALGQLLKATGSQPAAIQDDVHFTRFVHDDGGDVIWFDRRQGGDLNRVDVDWTRAVLADLGYEITDEWMPRIGQSWLSDGYPAGVSFRLAVRS